MSKKPDRVTHDRESSIPFASTGIGPTIHTTKIKKGKDTFSGSGWSKDESNKNAGRKYNRGETDKK
jgi:hypothetical protein